MSKHTEGPWQHLGDPEDDECRVRQTASVRHGDGFYSEITICENVRSKGNANLIAAAPDLLHALEYMLAYQYDMDPKAQAACDMCAKARAAISKAKGE